jgi:ketosteroid isomerase-like protein
MPDGGVTDLEKLQALYLRWAQGDFSGADFYDPGMQTKSFGMGEWIEGRNLEEVAAVMREWLSTWERPLRVDVEEFVQSGDRILALVHWRGRGKGSGVEMEAMGAHIWTFRDGLAVRFDVYRDRDEAQAAFDAG